MTRITVAVCTWNRAPLLDQTLAQIQRMAVPVGIEWELLVVDNNSTDDTSRVVERYTNVLPIRRIFEQKQGLSIARNRAIDEATGDLILWTDDDVLVDPGWLSAYVEAASRWPEAMYFGGEITPWYESEPPRWIEDNLDLLHGMLVIRDLGGVERTFFDDESLNDAPYGANMAFRREVLRRFRFNPAFGSNGHRKVFGDESQLLALLRSRGMQGVWVPSAKVQHCIPKERATLRYLRFYFYWHGRTLALEEICPDGPLLWGAPRFLYRRCWSRLRRAAIARVKGRPDWIELLVNASRDKGRIYGFRERLARRRTSAHAVEAS